jgi:Nuclease-related domain
MCADQWSSGRNALAVGIGSARGYQPRVGRGMAGRRGLDYAVYVDQETGPGESGTARAAPPTTRQKAPPAAMRPARPILGGLADDPRLPIWITRAVLAGIAAIGFTVWQGWRLGLTAAVVVAIADTIFRSRTTSHIPAAVRVTSAQRRTRRRLMALRTAGYLSLHRRAIPDSDSVIDHLVVGPAGVFAVDSEYWDRRLPVRTVSSGLLYHGPYLRKERLEHAKWEAGQASAFLSAELGRDIKARPAIVIYGPTIPWTVASLDGVDVLAGGRLRKYFTRQTKLSRGSRLDPGQIQEIQEAAARALPPAH